MNTMQEEVCRRGVTLLGLVLVAAFALPGASALAQSNPIMPKFSIGDKEKRPLTPEEQARQKQIDDDYKSATSKIPTQKAPDPWADVRQAPAGSAGPKASASTQNASVQKKKQSAQQPQ